MNVRLAFVYMVGLMTLWHQPGSAQVTLRALHTDDFPEVKLVLNLRQPEELDTAEWVFKHGTTELAHRLDSVVQPPVVAGTDYLFLIENAPFAEFSDQLAFFQALMAEALPEVGKPEDRFFLAHFDWKEMTNPVLRWVIADGVAHASEVIDALNEVQQPVGNGRKHRTTELFPAIDEALKALHSKGRPENPKAVVVLSREVQNIYNATPTESDLIRLARDYNIAVCAVGYPPAAPFTKYIGKVKTLVEGSYGERLEVAAGASPADCKSGFVALLSRIGERALGHDYCFTVETATKAGVGDIALEVIAGNARTAIAVPAPSYFDWVWADSSRRMKLLLAAILIPLFLGGIAFVFVRKSAKRRALNRASRQAEVDAIKLRSDDVANQLQSERERRDREALEAAQRAEALQRNEVLTARQQAFNRLANKPLLIGPAGVNYSITQFSAVIGRSAAADVRLNDDAVSGKHAILSFGDASNSNRIDQAFYLTDLGSTNGSFVNGIVLRPQMPHRLNDNDILVVGSTTLIFRT